MDVYRLLKDELSYELFIRGLQGEGTVAELRKRLANALGSNVLPVERIFSALSPKEELTFCGKKLNELKQQAEIVEESDANEIKRLKTRLLHVEERLNRIMKVEKDKEKVLESFKNDVKDLWGFIKQIEEKTEIRELPPPPSGSKGTKVNVVESNPTGETTLRTFLDMPAALTGQSTQCQNFHETFRNRDLMLYKWGLKFTGDDQDQPLCSFLAQVEDRAMSRRISKDDLFQSVSEILGGTALVWYRSKRNVIKSWEELVAGLRKTFLDPDYDHQLMEEIRRRTQGPQESIAIYIARMQALFSRLSEPISEEQKLAIIKRNVKKEYRALLPLTSFHNIEELETVLQNLEIGATMASRYEEPPTKGTLEPDLAYRGPRGKTTKACPVSTSPLPSTSSEASKGTRPIIKCWHCHQVGHTYRFCPKRNRSPNSSQPSTSSLKPNASCPNCQKKENFDGGRA